MSPPGKRSGPPPQEPAGTLISCHTDSPNDAPNGSPPPAAPARRPRPTANAGLVFTRYLIELATTDERVIWSEFAARAAECFTSRPFGSAMKAWRGARIKTLTALGQLGLEAVVTRTDDHTPLGEHYADLAGLVQVRAARSGDRAERLDARTEGYVSRMGTAHGLALADNRVPRMLRAFCGQLDAEQSSPPPHWLDHVHSWIDPDGEPVLTAEPYDYADSPGELVSRVNAFVADEALPLRVVGPYAGVWSSRAILVQFRHDPNATPLRAEHAPVLIPGWVERSLEPALLNDGWRSMRAHHNAGELFVRNMKRRIIRTGYVDPSSGQLVGTS